MRNWLIAGLLGCTPLMAIGQTPPIAVVRDSDAAALQRMGLWVQKMAAIQQPLIDRYQQCAPTMQQVVAVMQSAEAGRGERAKQLLPAMRQCIADMQTAILKLREGFAGMEPMPHEVETFLHINSRDFLNRSAAASAGMATYLQQVGAALEASSAGDHTLAQTRLAEARAGAGNVIDAQIVMLELLRQSMPLPTHKDMFDVRLATMRSMKAIVTVGPVADEGQLSAQLRGFGADALAAATRLRADWPHDSAPLRAAVAGAENPPQATMLAVMDSAFGTIASVSEEMAAMLSKVPAGSLPPPDRVRVANQLAAAEVRVLEAIRSLGNSAAQVR